MTWPQDLNKVIAEKVADENARKANLERWRIQRELFAGKGCTKPAPRWDPSQPVLPRQDSMGAAQGSRLQNAIDTAKRLDHEYKLALQSGDRQRQHEILKQFADLMTSDGGGHGGDGHDHDPHEPHSPPDPGRATREAIPRENIPAVLRNLSPQELANLRAAPTPNDAPRVIVIPPTTPRARK